MAPHEHADQRRQAHALAAQLDWRFCVYIDMERAIWRGAGTGVSERRFARDIRHRPVAISDLMLPQIH